MITLGQRTCALLAVAALTLCLASCGGGGGGSSDSSTTSSGKEGVNHGRFPVPVKDGTYAEKHPGSAEYGTPPLEIEADPSGKLAYTSDKVMVKEGNAAIEFTNPQSAPQNLAVEIIGTNEQLVSETITEGFTAMAMTFYPDKKYIYYSTLPGHRKAGMQGVIKVTPAK
jgi:plastocyanin